QPAEGGFQL
nr:Chain B, pCPB7 [synthetic construct]